MKEVSVRCGGCGGPLGEVLVQARIFRYSPAQRDSYDRWKEQATYQLASPRRQGLLDGWLEALRSERGDAWVEGLTSGQKDFLANMPRSPDGFPADVVAEALDENLLIELPSMEAEKFTGLVFFGEGVDINMTCSCRQARGSLSEGVLVPSHALLRRCATGKKTISLDLLEFPVH